MYKNRIRRKLIDGSDDPSNGPAPRTDRPRPITTTGLAGDEVSTPVIRTRNSNTTEEVNRSRTVPSPAHERADRGRRPRPKRTHDDVVQENEPDSPLAAKRPYRLTKTKPPVNADSSGSEDEIAPSQTSFRKTPLANSTQLSVRDRPKSSRKLSRPIIGLPYFEEALLMSGFRLGKGDSRNILDRDQPVFLLKFEAEIQKNGRAQKNLDEFLKGLETYISEPQNFHKALEPTDTEDGCSATNKSEACLIRLMLTVDSVQPKLMNILFEKLISIICTGDRQDDAYFELVQKILRSMRFLDRLIDGPTACDQLLNMIELAESDQVKREVILFIPDIIGDAEQERLAGDLSEMLAGNPAVIPAVLGSLENLAMSAEVREAVVVKVLDILDRASLDQQHTVMKFLTTVAKDIQPVVREIRKNIYLDPAADGSEAVIFAGNLKEAVLTSKKFLDTWLDIITNMDKATFLPVDFIALLVFYQNSLDRKKVEVMNAIKQHAHLGLEADKAISHAFPVVISVIETHMDTTLNIASTLLRSKDQSVSLHATIWFSLLVEHLQGTLSQQVINELLGHVGSGTSEQVSLALDILFDTGSKKIQSIAPYAHQLYMSVVRNSRFRHVFGKVMKRENCYENIRVSKSSLDSMACAVNPKFLAIIVESSGGGAFLVIPLTKYGRVPPDQPLVDGHRAQVTDLAFSPHDDNTIASASEDCTAKVWHIPDGGPPSPLSEPVANLVYHRRRVSLLAWHPTAAGVLLTAGADDRVAVWDVATGETLLQLDCHPDTVFSASWSWDGARLATTCRDKRLRIIDPRRGVVLEEAICHEGTKPTRAVFLKNGQIFTTGFGKMSAWQYSLREPGRLSEPLCLESNDSTNGIVFPLYDADTNLVYLCGKGDSLIRYYEITGEAPYVHPINLITTPEPQRGIGMMPKRGCDVRTCEVARFYRLTSSGHCQVISMNCPRKSELFQSDLYPDTPSGEPALTAEQWMSGLDADPVLESLRFDGASGPVRSKPSPPTFRVTTPAFRVATPESSDDTEEDSSEDDRRSRSASNLSTLEVRPPRTRGTSLGEDGPTESPVLRARSASSYVSSSLDKEVASHEERLRVLEALLRDGARITATVPKPDAGGGYSGRQYAELKTLPRCGACDEIIFDEEYTCAQGKSYHVKHFTCFKCDKPLAGNEYFLILERDLPMCFLCHQERP